MEESLEGLELSEDEISGFIGRQEPEAPQKPPVWKRLTALVAVDRWVSSVENWLNIAGVILIMGIMLMTVTGVVSRYFFNQPLIGTVDITELAMVGVVFLGLAFTLRVGGHIRVELFINMLKGRRYHFTEFTTLLLPLFFFAITFYSSLQFTIKAWKVWDVTAVVYLPNWPAKMLLTIGSFLICLRLIILLIQHLSQALAGVKRRDL